MAQTPSNPSPYSAELQTFLVSKYDPLLGVVKTLNERLHATNRDVFKVQQRMDAMEKNLHEIRELLLKSNKQLPPLDQLSADLKKSDIADIIRPSTQMVASWLFSCQLNTPASAIQLMLDFLPDQTAELDVRDWKRESDMWIDFLENVPDNVPFSKPPSLSLADLRASARSALNEMVKREVLVIIRSVPGKDAAAKQSASLVLVGIICGAIGEAWRRAEQDGDFSTGRVVVVLDGDGLASKLHTGDQKLVIEPLH
ncbi:putative apicomplexan specific coiled coil protein [Gregarina niphandrodes]|uniref:Apicomplexan specific coiled coil protein n=1 Tax=Gregarina niphandrodes TaxID=110365 RepID=A0A023B369_GRENI|nr:putative apicomplexan specific coiled coil protein [Gregarina niphandrodes]EZG55379.1 putative apicomplexan specific coiled coil protein [Gregarina niphandrodes]|eukprot:XP_011131603.1 putative apicomplexan specific coiled coil protein [Gregarina niphandrodes]